jgi:ubiquinone/menaquinone biosynthesis C-methylase UbiE
MSKHPAWFYDELQQVGVDFEDMTQVAAYDRNQTSNTPEACQVLIEQLGIAAGHTVIELGTGTGTFAIQSALVRAKVYAVDVSQAMLTYAKQKASMAGVESIEFHQAGFLTYEHQGNLADFIVTKFALHHLSDFWKMAALLRMASMLKVGGILCLKDVVFSFEAAQYQDSINAWIERVAKPAGQGFTASDFETHVREEHSTFSWIIEGMLTRAGFEIESADYPTPEYAQYICRKIGRCTNQV